MAKRERQTCKCASRNIAPHSSLTFPTPFIDTEGMSLLLHRHPLSSYCHKALFALYENGTPFEARDVNLMDPAGRAAFEKLNPLGKMPVLEDTSRALTFPETTILLEYLDQNYPGHFKLFPSDPALCLQARLWDRLIDLHLHDRMQKVVGDFMLPAADKHPHGVEEAKNYMSKTYALLDKHMSTRQWILGDTMSVADCAALPALFYGQFAHPYAEQFPSLVAYFERIYARPGARRALDEAKPFFQYFPFLHRMPARFL
jgi:glutathione S-transferase